MSESEEREQAMNELADQVSTLESRLIEETNKLELCRRMLSEEKAKFSKAAETLGVIQFAMNTLKVSQ